MKERIAHGAIEALVLADLPALSDIRPGVISARSVIFCAGPFGKHDRQQLLSFFISFFFLSPVRSVLDLDRIYVEQLRHAAIATIAVADAAHVSVYLEHAQQHEQ